MNLKCYRINEENQLAETPFETLQESWSRGEGCYWIDVEDYQTEELSTWLSSFNLSSVAMQVCTEQGETTRVVPLRQEVFFGFPVYASGAASNRVFLTFLCLKNLCITLHRTPIESLPKIARASSSGLGLPEATTSTLVSTLLIGLGAPIVDGTVAARTAVLALEERMDHDPDAVEIGQILNQGDVIRGLDSIVSEHVFCFAMLGLVDSPVLSLAANGYFHTVTSTAQHLDRTVDRLETHVADLRQRYGMNQQDRTNRHLAVLTAVAAIFLPLTLLTGIYGMNFAIMPELHFRYSYPIVLGCMVILAGGLVCYFRSRGWFK